MGYGGEFGQPPVIPLRDPFSFVCSPDRPSSRRSLHMTTSARTLLDNPMQRTCNHMSLERAFQAETDGNGQESTSLAVDHWFVLPAVMAGIRWRSRCARRLPLVLEAA